MSIPGFVKIVGESQGPIDGSCKKKGMENTIEVYSFEHGVQTPRNQETGLYTGIRVHQAFEIHKEIDKSTPKLYQALCKGECLDEVLGEWYRFTGKSSPEKVYAVKLTKAFIVGIHPWMPPRLEVEQANLPLFEKVSMVYEKITWTWVPDGIEYEDSWKRMR